jgi:hypothetical protein
MPLFNPAINTRLACLQFDLESLLNQLFEQLDANLEVEKKEAILQDFERSKYLLRRFEIL